MSFLQTNLIFHLLLWAPWFPLWKVSGGVFLTVLSWFWSCWWCWCIGSDWVWLSSQRSVGDEPHVVKHFLVFCTNFKGNLSCFIMYENSSFPPQRMPTKHARKPIALCSLVQMNASLSSVSGKAPSLTSSSFNFRYQNLIVSASLYTFFRNFCIWFILASIGGLTYTVCFITLPCKNAVLASNEFNTHLLDAIIEQVRWRPSLEHVGLSVLKFCSSSKPLAHNHALIIFLLSTNFSVITLL